MTCFTQTSWSEALRGLRLILASQSVLAGSTVGIDAFVFFTQHSALLKNEPGHVRSEHQHENI